MENLHYYEKFRNVPTEAQKSIAGGRLKGFTDINPMWRIKALTEQFGPVGLGWYYDILEKKLEPGAKGEIMASVDINLFVKYGEEWSKPIFGTGGSMFIANEKAGLYTSDECFKMALTDAISISCKALGIGANVYWSKDRTKYDQTREEPAKAATKVNNLDAGLIRVIDSCTTIEALSKLWNNNKELHTSKEFITKINNRKKILTENGISN